MLTRAALSCLRVSRRWRMRTGITRAPHNDGIFSTLPNRRAIIDRREMSPIGWRRLSRRRIHMTPPYCAAGSWSVLGEALIAGRAEALRRLYAHPTNGRETAGVRFP